MMAAAKRKRGGRTPTTAPPGKLGLFDRDTFLEVLAGVSNDITELLKRCNDNAAGELRHVELFAQDVALHVFARVARRAMLPDWHAPADELAAWWFEQAIKYQPIH